MRLGGVEVNATLTSACVRFTGLLMAAAQVAPVVTVVEPR